MVVARTGSPRMQGCHGVPGFHLLCLAVGVSNPETRRLEEDCQNRSRERLLGPVAFICYKMGELAGMPGARPGSWRDGQGRRCTDPGE